MGKGVKDNIADARLRKKQRELLEHHGETILSSRSVKVVSYKVIENGVTVIKNRVIYGEEKKRRVSSRKKKKK